MNVLILEDTPNFASDMIDVCRKLGLDVEQEECYQAARLCIRDHLIKYDFILLDHFVPRWDGFDDEPIGYGLQADIQRFQPRAIVIGTSSVPDDILKKTGFAIPPHKIDKSHVEGELTPLLQRLMGDQ